jgi:hypothetical protein
MYLSLQGAGTAPLPPHKFSPHDIVRLRPSKGGGGEGGGAPLAEGVVYRVRDAAITVAGVLVSAVHCASLQCAAECDSPVCRHDFARLVNIKPSCFHHSAAAVDEVPEEGLDVPLRLEKMANDVTYKRLKAALTVRAAPHTTAVQRLLRHAPE